MNNLTRRVGIARMITPVYTCVTKKGIQLELFVNIRVLKVAIGNDVILDGEI